MFDVVLRGYHCRDCHSNFTSSAATGIHCHCGSYNYVRADAPGAAAPAKAPTPRPAQARQAKQRSQASVQKPQASSLDTESGINAMLTRLAKGQALSGARRAAR